MPLKIEPYLVLLRRQFGIARLSLCRRINLARTSITRPEIVPIVQYAAQVCPVSHRIGVSGSEYLPKHRLSQLPLIGKYVQ
jgi:hypothetical protein